MRVPGWWVLAAAVALISVPVSAQPHERVDPSWSGDHDREFDFWVGEWDVNLRTPQDDHSWKDSIRSRAKIFRILDGKAILELWDEQKEGAAIRGFSLRHYDHTAKDWVLYLNWPGQNRSGISSLTGDFRHGRGEFFSTRKNQDGTETISHREVAIDGSKSRDESRSRPGGTEPPGGRTDSIWPAATVRSSPRRCS